MTGGDLGIAAVWVVAVEAAPVSLADEARTKTVGAGELVDRASSGDHAYGVNTGLGRLVPRTIPAEQVEELQRRLLRSHARGVGEPYPADVVRAPMLLRANALATGYSGACVATVELLVECLNRGVPPRVDAVREQSERLRDDRPLPNDVERAARAVDDGTTLAAAEADVGDLR